MAVARMSDIYAPGFKEMPYWWEAAPPEAGGSHPLPETTDVAVVGGGYAGLSVALELARNGTAVTVLEQGEFGAGASTRNGGAVSAGVSVGRGLSGNRNRSEDFQRGGAESFEHLDTIIRREAIACHWEIKGRFLGAHCKRHFAGFPALAETLNRVTNANAVVVPPERQREEIASDHYRGGLVIGRSGKLHPALYHQGLLAAARRAGATLVANAQVVGIERRPQRFLLTTSTGRLSAREVALCTNGYTDRTTPELRRRLIPVASHIIATEPLDPAVVKSLIPNNRTISETRRVLCYYRQSPDGTRVIFGGRARFTPVSPRVSAPILHGFMLERFPQLKGTRITHAWTGNVAFTFDYVPHMGVLDGMHYCGGCNGSGVAMMSYLGHAIARKLLSGANRVNPFDREEFPTRAGYSGNPWFLSLIGAYYRGRDRIDRWLDA
jgi:glycine/D-amino acid oxidase-like deaminating enzyme